METGHLPRTNFRSGNIRPSVPCGKHCWPLQEISFLWWSKENPRQLRLWEWSADARLTQRLMPQRDGPKDFMGGFFAPPARTSSTAQPGRSNRQRSVIFSPLKLSFQRKGAVILALKSSSSCERRTPGFRAAKLESQRRLESNQDAVVIHTGFWGCGVYGNDRVLIALLQILAARLAGWIASSSTLLIRLARLHMNKLCRFSTTSFSPRDSFGAWFGCAQGKGTRNSAGAD